MIRLGTRGSHLARTQSGLIADALAPFGPVELVIIRSEGDDTTIPLDAPARRGAFVATLQDALLAKRVDVVVHSFKDLPSAPRPGLIVAAVPVRADPRDVLVARDGLTLATLPAGATVGTSSPRRAAALLRARPDLTIAPLRGNVDTRLRAVTEGRLDAIVLAVAGLQRIGLFSDAMTPLSPEVMLPAPAQGALALECRDDDPLASQLATLDDREARLRVIAERTVLAEIEAACTTAVGALATRDGRALTLTADLAAHRGVDYARVTDTIALPTEPPEALAAARSLGRRVAQALLAEAL